MPLPLAFWRWLAPCAGCLALVLMGLHPRPEHPAVSTETSRFAAAASSNQSYAAYITAAFHSEQNALAPETLEWTFARRPASTIGSLPAAATNHLTH